MKPTRITIVSALILLFAAAPVHSATGPRPGWEDYVNVRYGFAICYPTALFKAQGESPNGDGEKFQGRGGAMLETFSAAHEGETLAQSLNGEIAGFTKNSARILYKASKKDNLTASGTFGERVFYSRAIKQGDRFVVYQLAYPKTQQSIYGPVISKINRCFGTTRVAARLIAPDARGGTTPALGELFAIGIA